MSIRLAQITPTIAASAAFAALCLAAPAAHADVTPSRPPAVRSDAKAAQRDVLPWSRRFPPRATSPAAFSRPRIAAQTKAAPPAPRPVTAPAVAPAATAPSPTMVAIEIREIHSGGPTQIERFSLPLGDLGSSKIESRVGDVEYRIAVVREGSPAASQLAFDVRKSHFGPKSSSSEAQVRASVRMSAGQHVVIAAMDRSDGSRTEVLAQLK